MKKSLTIIFLLLTCLGCGSTISLYDQYAYQKTTSIKVDALELMDSATDDFADHGTAVKAVNTEISKVIEYEAHRQKNQITVKLWQQLTDSTAHLYGGFIGRWRTQKKLSPVFIANQKVIIGKAFDQIAELETSKNRP
jgi:hypothetical protein